MRILSTEQLGPKQSLTPEGYLLCEAVPIARTGTQIYAGMELPHLEDGLDGLITVVREESEVFSPITMASFEGKSVTIGHTFVDPDSWAALTKGTVQNVRRGLDADSDLLLADLLITDADAIAQVRIETDDKGRPIPGQNTLREVSCGYDAEYEQESPGVAFQRSIVGNHVALVPRGRAGPRCSIQDEESHHMATKTTVPLLKRFLAAARSGDLALIKRTADAAESEVEAEEKRVADEEAEAKEKKTEDTIAGLTKSMDALTALVTKMTKDGMGPTEGVSGSSDKVDTGENPIGDEDLDDDGKPKAKAGDEEPDEAEKKKTADAMRHTMTRAELLAPGFKLPTADSARRFADVVAVQRKVLVAALKTADGKEVVEGFLDGRTLDAMSGADITSTFIGASMVMRSKNNASGARTGVQTKDSGKVVTPADINARNAAFWAKH